MRGKISKNKKQKLKTPNNSKLKKRIQEKFIYIVFQISLSNGNKVDIFYGVIEIYFYVNLISVVAWYQISSHVNLL